MKKKKKFENTKLVALVTGIVGLIVLRTIRKGKGDK